MLPPKRELYQWGHDKNWVSALKLITEVLLIKSKRHCHGLSMIGGDTDKDRKQVPHFL